MLRLNPSELKDWVTLDDPIVDGTPKVFHPNRVKVRLRSIGPSGEDRLDWDVLARFHPQITLNTRMTLDDGRQLFVRGMHNVGDADRSGGLSLRCEEVQTP